MITTKCFISVGEYSGDLLASEMVSQLKDSSMDIEFYGVVGPCLSAQGVKKVCSIDDMSVIGLFDILYSLGKFKHLQDLILEVCVREKITIAVLVDFPGFHFILAERLKLLGIKVVQYIAPKLWAWGQSRASLLRENFDLVMGIFPFEETFFKNLGVPYVYVGCPHVKRMRRIQISKKDLGFKEDQEIISVLPGSRKKEVERIQPKLKIIMTELAKENPRLLFVIPIPPSLNFNEYKNYFETHFNTSSLKGRFCVVEGQSLEIMSVSKAGIITSGTATLECGLLKTPLIVLYKTDPMTYDLAKKKVKLKWISLVNILLDKAVVPEFIQDFNENEVVQKMSQLLQDDSAERVAMLDDLTKLEALLEVPPTTTLTSCIKSLQT